MGEQVEMTITTEAELGFPDTEVQLRLTTPTERIFLDEPGKMTVMTRTG